MQPVKKKTWRRLPGYDSVEEDSDDSDEEAELKRVAAKRLPDLIKALGAEWADVPCVKFSPPSQPSGPGAYMPLQSLPSQWGANGPLPKFRIERIRAPAVRETLETNGLRQALGNDWILSWSGPGMKEAAYQALHEYQRVNHFPGSSELTQKDKLWLHFHRMARRYGREAFDFVPDTFVMPEQAQEFRDVYERTNHIWIVKPHASSQGKGIFLLRDLKELPLKDVSVVSKYVDNPLLIQGLKFDLRIYVLVTSYEPLRVYVYREGLTRFASKPYSTDEEHLKDAYRHLTNYSINKFAQNFVENQQVKSDNVGHKWSLSALNKHLQHTGIDSDLMWSRIMDLIVKSLLSVEPHIAAKTRKNTVHDSQCFELYGFDVLVDETLKPWLLEVNLSPCMNAESPLDWTVKSSLLSDTFNLVGIRRADFQTIASARMRQRLLQLKKLKETTPGWRRISTPEAGQRNETAAQAESLQEAEMPKAVLDALAGRSALDPDAEKAMLADALNKSQLKSLAYGLQEIGRRQNFIRLYPTRATVTHYAPITASRSATKVGNDPVHRNMSQLYASLMFGADVALAAYATEASQPSGSSNDCKEAEAFDSDASGAHDDKDAEKATDLQRDAAIGDDEDRPFRDADLAASATRSLMVLGTKVGSRLAFMEYLIRICNLCAGLGAATKAKLVESRAPRIAAFRQQLSVYLRTTPASMSQAKEDISSIIEGSCLLDRLASTSKAVLVRLVRSAWGVGVSIDAAPNAGLTLARCSPPAFVQTGSGSRAVSALEGLSVADLEGVLLGPHCSAEFRSMLQCPNSGGCEDAPFAALLCDSLGQDGARPSSASLRRHIEEWWGVPCGPLGELWQLTRAPPQPAAPKKQVLDSEEPSTIATVLAPAVAEQRGWPGNVGRHGYPQAPAPQAAESVRLPCLVGRQRPSPTSTKSPTGLSRSPSDVGLLPGLARQKSHGVVHTASMPSLPAWLQATALPNLPGVQGPGLRWKAFGGGGIENMDVDL